MYEAELLSKLSADCKKYSRLMATAQNRTVHLPDGAGPLTRFRRWVFGTHLPTPRLTASAAADITSVLTSAANVLENLAKAKAEQEAKTR